MAIAISRFQAVVLLGLGGPQPLAADLPAAPGPRHLQAGLGPAEPPAEPPAVPVLTCHLSPPVTCRSCRSLRQVLGLDVLPLPLRGRGPPAALATPALPFGAHQRAGPSPLAPASPPARRC